MFYTLFGSLMYLAYDFAADDACFLDKMERNLNSALEMTEALMNDPLQFRSCAVKIAQTI